MLFKPYFMLPWLSKSILAPLINNPDLSLPPCPQYQLATFPARSSALVSSRRPSLIDQSIEMAAQLIIKPSLAVVVLAQLLTAAMADYGWNSGTATFYGGSDGSGTMGGACGYDNLYNAGYGVLNAALSETLFNDGASCGQCYNVRCDTSKSVWCKPGNSITVTATNLCPANYALSNGGWCGSGRQHFDMSQPAWENIGIYRGGIIPVFYQRVSCSRQGGVRFRITGSQYFQLVLITNVAGSGSIQSMSVKGTNTGWIAMTRNWGANWQCNSALLTQALSFIVTTTGGQTRYINDVVPSWWVLGMTFATNVQFDY